MKYLQFNPYAKSLHKVEIEEMLEDMYDFAAEKAVKWIEENIVKETSVFCDKPFSMDFTGVIEGLEKHMKDEQ